MKTNDELIEAVLNNCYENRGLGYCDLDALIDSIAGYEVDDKDKRRIEFDIQTYHLLDQVPSGYGANAKTCEIVKKGGYIKYKTGTK